MQVELKGTSTMIDNTKRIENLEIRMNGFETILREIKDAMVGNKTAVAESGTITCKVNTKESDLSEVEVAKIKSIMASFDFDKVHDIMNYLDWKWAMTKYGVPTVEELKNEAHRILVDACYEKTNISTGGFRAVYESTGPADDDPYVGLEFIVEECEGFVDDDEN